jgi:hypothetical protein
MAYADGELTVSERERVSAHLEHCGSCQQTLASLRQVSDDLGRWSLETAPPMNPPAGGERSGSRISRWLFGPTHTSPYRWIAAAGFVVIVFGVLMVGRGDRRTPVDAAASTLKGSARAVGEPTFRESYARRMSTTPAEAAPVAPQGQAGSGVIQSPAPGANVIRTIALSIVAADVDAARPAIDDVLRRLSGFVGTMHVTGTRNQGRTIRASLRIPSSRVDEAVARLRALGKVVDESHGGEDVTAQVVDIDARLVNNRNTEKRLTDVLQNRTGKVGDILEVEREIARVRAEIEQLDAQRKNLADRVSYATVALAVTEERQATLGSGALPLRTQLRNALVDGLQFTFDSAAAVALALLRVAPAMLLWTAILWWPVRRTYRALRS